MKKLFLLLILIPCIAFGQKPQELVHDTHSYVDDFAGIYTTEQKAQLNSILHSFWDTVQIDVVTIKSLGGYDISDFSTKLFNYWGVGSASNNGLLVVIAPNEHKAFAATGRAIQGDLTDLQAAELQRELMVPEFKKGNYFEGTRKLLVAYIGLLSPSAKEYNAAQKKKQAQKAEDDFNTFMQVCVYAICFLILAISIGVWMKKQKQKAKDKKVKEAKIKQEYFEYKNSLKDLYQELSISSQDNYKPLRDALIAVWNPQIIEWSKYMEVYTKEIKKFFIDNADAIKEFRANEKILLASIKILETELSDSSLSYIDSEIKRISNILPTFKFVSITQDDMDELSAQLSKLYYFKSYISSDLSQKKNQNLSNLLKNASIDIAKYKSLKSHIDKLIETDKKNVLEVESAKDNLNLLASSMLYYVKLEGVSSDCAERTKKEVGEALDKMNPDFFDKLDIRSKYAQYIHVKELLNKCTYAKDEYETYVREQENMRAQKRRNEQLAAAAITTVAASSYLSNSRPSYNDDSSGSSYSSSSSYSSDDSSSSSSYDSSSSSDSIFGGGSSDGGGGGSDW